MQPTLQLHTSLPRPSWPPTENEWDTYKPLITDLYIEKDQKLDRIKELLEARYGFKASTRMYKARLTRWKLKKYFSARDKESVAQLLDTYRRRGIEASEITLNGARIPLHVIRRHCRRKRIFDEICDSLPWNSEMKPAKSQKSTEVAETSGRNISSPTTVAMSHCQAMVTIPQRQLSLETDLDVVQYILILTNQYFDWQFGRNGSEEQLELAKRPASIFSPQFTKVATRASSFWKSIISGLDLLHASQPRQAWQAFDQGCSLAKSVLQEQRRGLLKLIYLLFSDDRWQHFSDWRIAILNFLSKMSAEILAENHPLTIITRLCEDPIVLYKSSQRIHEVLAAIFRNYARQNAAQTGQFQQTHGEKLRYAAAELEAQAIVSESEIFQRPNGEETRKALQLLAHIHIDQGNYSSGEAIFLEVIERARIELGDDYLDEPSIFSHQNLACLSDMQGNLEQAEAHWRLAFNGAVLHLGVGHYETQYCRQNLDCVRLRRGLIDPKVCVHDFLATCALQRRPSMSATPPPLARDWVSRSRLNIDGDLRLQVMSR